MSGPAGRGSSPIRAPAGGRSVTAMSAAPVYDDATLLEHALFEIRRVIVGQDRLVERLMVALLAGGHILLEGPPGVAKTLAAETTAKVVGGTFARVQFTPDLLPSDITGTRVYRASTEEFDVELGPVFVNLLLADEINRAPAKVQSALLELMAERQVTIGGTTFPLPDPFLVVATQNPAESEGVYPLPEAQRDRFLMKVRVDHPTPEEELEIARRMGTEPPTPAERLSVEELVRLQTAARSAIYVDHGVMRYAVDLVTATRDPARFGLGDLARYITCGVSSRATLGLIAAGRALALMRRRSFVLPQDVWDVAFDVLPHRLVLSYDAVADGVTAEQVVGRILATVTAPRLTPTQDATARPVPPTPDALAGSTDAAAGAAASGPRPEEPEGTNGQLASAGTVPVA
jgi:MoxR-like ATPase